MCCSFTIFCIMHPQNTIILSNEPNSPMGQTNCITYPFLLPNPIKIQVLRNHPVGRGGGKITKVASLTEGMDAIVIHISAKIIRKKLIQFQTCNGINSQPSSTLQPNIQLIHGRMRMKPFQNREAFCTQNKFRRIQQ